MSHTQIFTLLKWSDPATHDTYEAYLPLPATIGRDPNSALHLSSGAIDKEHALLVHTEKGLMVRDLNTAQGTYINGKPIKYATIAEGDSLTIGPFTMIVSRIRRESTLTMPIRIKTNEYDFLPDLTTANVDVNEVIERLAGLSSDPDQTSTGIAGLTTQQIPTAFFREQAGLPPEEPKIPLPYSPEAIFQDPIITQQALHTVHAPIEDITYLTIGGGVGSFVWVDHLRVHGVSKDDIRSIGFEHKPYGRYRRLCLNSQIPDRERLRSDSGSMPDNVWGFPGYAMQEMARDMMKGHVGHAAGLLWRLFGEPVLAESYTPIAADVFDAIDREAERIGWYDMARLGRVRQIRKTDDGRYAVWYESQNQEAHIMLANYIHLAIGYSGIRMLPDITKYRLETGDMQHAVNAYEDHTHVYDDLATYGGTVVVRGRGIVASRIIQRLYEVREASGADIRIIHLMRSPIAKGHQYRGKRRTVENHWEMQPYNFPKAAIIGKLQVEISKLDDDQRDALLNDWGGTTTADRGDWRNIIKQGLREGWYSTNFGAVSEVVPFDGRIATQICAGNKLQAQIISDYVIDATGLNAKIDDNPLLCDLLQTYKLKRNVKNRLKVTETFELQGMRNGNGRMFAVGAATLGNHFPAVDSFIGLQFAAQQTVDELAHLHAPQVKSLTAVRSANQWLKWARGVQP